jgi:putative membrane protein
MINPSRRATLSALALGAAVPAALFVSRALGQDNLKSSGADQVDYVAQTLTLGTLALKTSEVAVDKAGNAMVKEFAGLEVAEQKTVATVLSSTEAGKSPPPLPEDMAAKVKELQDAEAGDAFDKAYVDAQIDGHQKLLAVQKTLSGATDPTVEVITAKLAEQAITSHLAMLEHIQEQLA